MSGRVIACLLNTQMEKEIKKANRRENCVIITATLTVSGLLCIQFMRKMPVKSPIITQLSLLLCTQRK